MKVIDRILSKKVVSGDKSAITEETNRSLQQGLLFKLKKKWLKGTNKIGTA